MLSRSKIHCRSNRFFPYFFLFNLLFSYLHLKCTASSPHPNPTIANNKNKKYATYKFTSAKECCFVLRIYIILENLNTRGQIVWYKICVVYICAVCNFKSSFFIFGAVNPLCAGGLSQCYILDDFICHFRGVMSL